MTSVLFALSLLLQAPKTDQATTDQKKAKSKGEQKAPDKLTGAIGSMRVRSIGPALTSGRISGIAVHPDDPAHFFVAAASGGVWKTTNGGTTWTPVFDDQGSYSIGYVLLDPKNPNVVWVGTGENNSQRSVGYGDGVYKSEDGGRSWTNVGLKKSEHIGRILIDPRDSNTVYVAAQGPLWGPGGDRGLFKTTDGGKTWKNILTISENTGINDVVMDTRNPDHLLAAAYQRRRHVWTLINGGPESAILRSTDGGKTWKKITAGLPGTELGRIGLATSPSEPNVVYAIVESTPTNGGIFRSEDFGVTWSKQNDFDQQAQYYAHLVVDPQNSNRIYVMNVFLQVSDDAGRTLRPLGERSKHVDNHCMWIDPKVNHHYRVGCDGGLYETWDKGQTWRFHENLPLTQFYDVTCDENAPFYNVYGGTQDNFTLGGPAANRSVHGIGNWHWFVVLGGDGFHCKVDPKDPNIVYAAYQYGGLARYDRKTGLSVPIQPQPGKGEMGLRWNWDSPLVLSPHSNTRLYFAANKVFRSDDRGDSWKAVSGDLTRQIDRNQLEVMGKVWSPDAVSKSVSTSLYGNITAMVESPVKENLLFVGTDDGLIHVTEDAGQNWTKVETFAGVPDKVYVARLLASQHDADVVYAAFDNHKNSDFKPYLLKSSDRGKTWTKMVEGLPENGPVLAIAEDHKDKNLLFVGTEFGLYCTTDGCQKWYRIKGGLPTIAVRDLCIQKQMNDLVVGTFGRGIYILDDFSALRDMKEAIFAKEAVIFPTRDALLFLPDRQLGGSGKGMLGETLFLAPNPTYGAAITYYLKDSLKSKRDLRIEAEKAATKKKEKIKYPTPTELRAEVDDIPPSLVVKIRNAEGAVVRTVPAAGRAGVNKVYWDLREPAANLPSPTATGRGRRGGGGGSGPLVAPGTYTATLVKRDDGKETTLGEPISFQVKLDPLADPKEFAEQHEFQRKLIKLSRAMSMTMAALGDADERISAINRALDVSPTLESKWRPVVQKLMQDIKDIRRELSGDEVMRARNENSPVSVRERLSEAASPVGYTLTKPTETAKQSYHLASEGLATELAKLRKIIEKDIKELEAVLDSVGAPGTPGRLPDWKAD